MKHADGANGSTQPVGNAVASVDVASALTPAKMRWLLAGLMFGLFLSSTEQSVVSTALPTMAGELGGANRIAWVVSVYLLTSTIVTPLYGKLSDLYGRRRLYLSAIAIFIAGSLLCGVAQSINQLVLARAVQGLGGGGLMSLAFVILGDVVSPRDRGRYIGVFTSVFAFSSITGPLWGGLIVDSIGWRWVFLLIVPLGLLSLVVTNIGLRLPFATRKASIDWLGALFLVGASTTLILVPIWGGSTFPWMSWQILTTAGVGVLLTALLVRQEARTDEPILPLRLFRDRTVASIFAMGFGLMFAVIGVSTFLPLFFQVGAGLSATRSGLQLVPQTVGITLVSALTGNLVSRTGRYKWALLSGPPIATVGVALLTTIDGNTSYLLIAPYLVLLGLGMGLIFPNLTLTVQNAVEIADLGVGTSTANFFRSMGAAFGAAIAGALLTFRLDGALSDRIAADELSRLGGAEGLIRTPASVKELPLELGQAVSEAVTSSVTWTMRWIIPVLVAVFLIANLVVEKPLRTTSSMGPGAKPDGGPPDPADPDGPGD